MKIGDLVRKNNYTELLNENDIGIIVKIYMDHRIFVVLMLNEKRKEYFTFDQFEPL